MKIIKMGNVKNKKTEVIYKKTCERCGCKFSFEISEMAMLVKSLAADPEGLVECPCCHYEMPVYKSDRVTLINNNKN